MSIFDKIIDLSSRTASSILKREKPESLADSDLFTDSDKEYILKHLTDEKLLKKRAVLLQQFNKKEDWKAIQSKIDVPVKKLQIWKYAAAVAVLILGSTLYFSKNHLIENEPNKVVVTKSVITPGTDKAILVLASGEQVALGKGSVYNSTGVHSNGTEIIYKNDNTAKNTIAYNYLTIPRGGQFFIKLADGTKVWLNSESKLKFPVSFVDGQPRQVELVYGEAYFDVSPSTAHKGSHFNVLTQNQNVEVLGTEFNIKAYQDNQTIYTTLVEGKVHLTGSFNSTILKPGDQSVLENHNIRVAAVDVFNEVSWKEGIFSFQEMPLKDIMRVLERWYDIKTVFKNKAIENSTFNGILDKDQKIEEILNIISNTNKIPYEINQKTVIFK
ncbi:FecR family protein [Flavobacterium phragmitis]|uniref:FecR family protein n=1 Tax=Flavobacterium phragmitis TaxID=739143 RepID=A0A1I1T0W4_9FLAO|nr:FecR family protein [Flavobacterium phragmitis]SFD49843.1 FecR family protein [Flavobacterium phragmitis]